MRLALVLAAGLASCLVSACSNGPGPVDMPDANAVDAAADAFAYYTGPCGSDSQCPGTYCNPGTMLCCIPTTPSYEICGDRIDQNCDHHDESCGDTDGDGVQACMPGQDPLSGCDCDDELDTVRPPIGDVGGAPEICDGIDNDCNGRVDEAAQCCSGCESLGAERALRADICTETGECDCAGEPGTGPCAAGLRCCSGGCVDTTTDIENCGLCGAACTVSSDSCSGSQCRCGGGLPCDLDATCSAGSCG